MLWQTVATKSFQEIVKLESDGTYEQIFVKPVLNQPKNPQSTATNSPQAAATKVVPLPNHQEDAAILLIEQKMAADVEKGVLHLVLVVSKKARFALDFKKHIEEIGNNKKKLWV
ncbi:MAG: hypothetical protein OXC44_05555 [Proteobacteria bacterium]|nr:hypothetical protein [Pseudomonadota bacterium]